MKVTTQMIDAAMKKATEAGLFPRHARQEDVLINQELIRIVLQSALEAAPVTVTVLAAGQTSTSTTDLSTLACKRPFTPLSMTHLLVSLPG
ncbi:hypothetical protein ACFQUU_02595 [Herbaspirillum sp. GCM10030257]|uniref:hypothetical protein n=1 Tax=Herbaspirillum sp. GCM10030257 TaxID=3273393 RepID=UPI003617A3E7